MRARRTPRGRRAALWLLSLTSVRRWQARGPKPVPAQRLVVIDAGDPVPSFDGVPASARR